MMQRSDMVQQSDIKGRLNLLRYGLVVLVVVTFLIVLLVPYANLREVGGPITEFLEEALIATVIVAILSVIVYFGYAKFLERTVGKDKNSGESA